MKRRHWAVRVATAGAASVVFVALAPSCSLGGGTGTVSGTLNAPGCWSGKFNLNPDFFAANPYRDSVTIRVQNGSDFEAFSDGISVLVDNVHIIRGDAPFAPGFLHQALSVSLPPSVTPPGVPIQAVANPAMVHLTLYLQHSCHTQDVALYAVDSVSLNADGTCDPTDSGPLTINCNGGADASAGADGAPLEGGAASEGGTATEGGTTEGGVTGEGGVIGPPSTASSTITFDSLFDGNPDETDADQRHTVVSAMDIYLADPRDMCPGGIGPPPPCRGHITGNFDFYFDRGRPAQPFP